MSALPDVLALAGTMPAAETYHELLSSRSHWLFELTIEVVSAPVAFAVGWLWRNGLLRHLHRDLHALQHGAARPCVEPASASPVVPDPAPRTLVPTPAVGPPVTSPADRQPDAGSAGRSASPGSGRPGPPPRTTSGHLRSWVAPC